MKILRTQNTSNSDMSRQMLITYASINTVLIMSDTSNTDVGPRWSSLHCWIPPYTYCNRCVPSRCVFPEACTILEQCVNVCRLRQVPLPCCNTRNSKVWDFEMLNFTHFLDKGASINGAAILIVLWRGQIVFISCTDMTQFTKRALHSLCAESTKSI